MSRLLSSMVFIILLAVASNCSLSGYENHNPSQTETITGDLYFKLVSLGSFYEVHDSTIQKFENFFNKPCINESETAVLEYYNYLRENELLYKPYIHLTRDSESFYTVFLDEDDFELFEGFTHGDLLDKNQKVVVRLEGRFLDNAIIDCKNIISVDIMEGITGWRK